MSEQAKTPRTDALYKREYPQTKMSGDYWQPYLDMLDFARQLERELSSAEIARDNARASYQWALGALGAAYGDAHPDRAIEFYAAEIVKRAESAEARAQALEAALRELVRLREQRAELDDTPCAHWTREDSNRLHKSTLEIAAAYEAARALLKERGK